MLNIQEFGKEIESMLRPILLVEDDDIDKESFVRALKKNNIENPMFWARDGVEALEFLQGQNGRDKVGQPCLVFLDINMPRMNGLELLEEMRGHDEMKENIVVMLTTSSRSQDRERAAELNAAGYIVKSGMVDLAASLMKFFQDSAFKCSGQC